jgi:adenylate cyclase
MASATGRLGNLKRGVALAGPGRLALAGVVLLAAMLVARFSWNIPLLIAAERGLYDVRVDLTAPRVATDPRVVLVVFNEATLTNTGRRSPLDRTMLARALTNLDKLQPAGIGVDILIDQPQPEDPVLKAALLKMKTPTFFGFSSTKENGEFVMPWQEQHMREFFGGLAGTPVQNANIRLDVDNDNAWRSWPRPAMAPPPLLVNAITRVKGFEHYTGATIFRHPLAVDRPVFNSFPVDLFGDANIAPAFANQIRGHYVLVGADLPEADRFITPFTRISGKTTAGVELHAMLIAQALDGRKLSPLPTWSLWAMALLAVALGTLTGGFDLSGRWLLPAVLGQLFVIGWVPYALQGTHEWDTLGMPLVGPALAWLLALMAAAAISRIVGAEQRKFAQGALGKYLPRDVAEQILRDPEKLALSGERRPIYALFSDIEGFTSMCQSQPPEVVASTLNEYLDTMSDVVLKHGGTIDKFVADAVVAFWGAPLSRPDDATRALACAVEMSQAGERFKIATAERPAMGRTRVGLHWGDVVVGNFGGEGRIQYTALGDSMNVAARLEGANKTLKTAALVSGEAAGPMGLDRFRPMGRVRVRGREKPLEVFEPFGAGMARDDGLAALFARFDAGDLTALDEMRKRAEAAPEDVALTYLVRRLAEIGPGGVYDLD